MTSDGALHISSRGALITGCDDDAQGRLVLLPLFNLSAYGTQGAMVSNAALAAICVSCGLHKYLHFDSYALATTFDAYARQMETRGLDAEGAAEDDVPKQHWQQVEPPKVIKEIMW